MKWTHNNLLVCAFLIPVVVFFGRLGFGHFDITHFIVAGDVCVDAEVHPYPIKVNQGSDGYDGTFYYRLALNPFTKQNIELGIYTNLKYRKQRILYPFVSYLAAFGNPYLVPYSLVFVNLMCALIAIFFTHKFIKRHGSDPKHIFLIAGLVGFHIALTRNLAESMEGMFIILAVYFFLEKRIFWFAVMASLGLLTRETSLLVLFPAFLLIIWSQLKNRTPFSLVSFLAIVPLVVIASWKIYLHFQLGSLSPDQFGIIPLKGLIEAPFKLFKGSIHPNKYGLYLHWIYGSYCLFYLAWIFYTMIFTFFHVRIQKGPFNLWVAATMIIWFLIIVFFEARMFTSDLGFGRIFNGILILSFLFLMYNKIRIPSSYLFATLILYILAISRLIVMT